VLLPPVPCHRPDKAVTAAGTRCAHGGVLGLSAYAAEMGRSLVPATPRPAHNLAVVAVDWAWLLTGHQLRRPSARRGGALRGRSLSECLLAMKRMRVIRICR
jgi:hypothetical protein